MTWGIQQFEMNIPRMMIINFGREMHVFYVKYHIFLHPDCRRLISVLNLWDWASVSL